MSGSSAGQQANACSASFVAPAGRSAAGGGTLAEWYHNPLGVMFADEYTGALFSDIIQFNQGYQIFDNGFTVRVQAVDSSVPTMNIWQDGVVTAAATPRALTNTSNQVTLGANYVNPGYNVQYAGTYALALAFSVALTDSQVQALTSLIRRTVGTGLSWHNNVVIEGDSQAACSALGLDSDKWHYKLTQLAGNNWYGKGARVVSAVAGTASDERLAAYNASVFPYRNYSGGADNKPIFLLWIGINDVGRGYLADFSWSNIKAHHALARRDGFRTVAFTLPATNLYVTAEQDKQRVLLNTIIKNNPRAYDYLVDLAAIWPTWNATDFTDVVHLSAVGCTTCATAINKVLPAASV
jgi:hypothetical protein